MTQVGSYRGRIAPSPTGYLHVGHAITFWSAQERARAAGGELILRIENLDRGRCRPEFDAATIEDLFWFGIRWDEGPFRQSDRLPLYLDALEKLGASGFVYPCGCSRRDIAEAGLAPHAATEEPLYPGTCRPVKSYAAFSAPSAAAAAALSNARAVTAAANWRFRVPDEEEMEFSDARLGKQHAIAGKDFGDFVVWRRDDMPAYQLAVVVDDFDMKVTEVVRGEDLLVSTFRQLLIYRALGLNPPRFYHTSLIVDVKGKRLAKRDAALSLRALRESGVRPEEIRAKYL